MLSYIGKMFDNDVTNEVKDFLSSPISVRPIQESVSLQLNRDTSTYFWAT